MNGWWIFAGTAAVSLLSKHLVTFRGRHVFNPSNFGLVLCFLLLGPERADPLDVLVGAALAVARPRARADRGRRPRDPEPAPARRGRRRVLAHVRGRRRRPGAQRPRDDGSWHVGPLTGWELWRVLVTSPEILVFLFFMITDPRTTPASQPGRRTYAVAVGFLAGLLIAPWTSEFPPRSPCSRRSRSCAPPVSRSPSSASSAPPRAVARQRADGGWCRSRGVAAAAAVAGLLVVAGLPARPEAALAGACRDGALPQVTVAETEGLQTLDLPRANDRLGARRRARRRGRRAADARRDAREAAGDGPLAGGRVAADRRGPRRGAIEVPPTRSTASGCGSCAATGRGRRTILAVARGRGWTTTYGPPMRRRWDAPRRDRSSAPSSSCARGKPFPRDRPARDPRAAAVTGRAAPPRAHGRRGGRRPGLPPRCVPLRHGRRRGRDGDDGRRPLLARLRRRRAPRPLRRRHLRRERRARVQRARRPADEPPLPQPRRPLRGRHGRGRARASGSAAAAAPPRTSTATARPTCS